MDYEKFKEEIYKLTRINLHMYKETQMKRRIDAFIERNGFSGYQSFFQELTKKEELEKAFLNYLTINVSEFYRNPAQWRDFEENILPYLIATYGTKLRIWSAACSTGDEPYTLAMILSKHIPDKSFQIYATDIDEVALEKAAMGIYNKKSVVGLPEEFLHKYFVACDKYCYQISDEMKACVQFKKQNLLEDAYLKNMHLIVCRNVVIYFTEEAKETVYKRFNESLASGGVLFIGSTEQIIRPKQYHFEQCRSFFYKKIN